MKCELGTRNWISFLDPANWRCRRHIRRRSFPFRSNSTPLFRWLHRESSFSLRISLQRTRISSTGTYLLRINDYTKFRDWKLQKYYTNTSIISGEWGNDCWKSRKRRWSDCTCRLSSSRRFVFNSLWRMYRANDVVAVPAMGYNKLIHIAREQLLSVTPLFQN